MSDVSSRSRSTWSISQLRQNFCMEVCIMIEGRTIYLRPLSPSDIPVWAAWFNDPNVTEHMNKGAVPNTETAQAEFLAQLARSKTDVQFAIVAKGEDCLIGTIGIHKIDWIHRHGSISILVGDKAYWGRNIGTEAVELIVRHTFTKLNLHRLTAGMWSSNPGSRACFEKNGFLLEGTLRESFFRNGLYVDEHVMGLLRSEWESR